MRDHHEELTASGARVIAVGMGWPEMAAHFKREFDIPFTLLVDHDRETYQALGLARANPWNVYGPPVWIEGIRSILNHGNKIPKQDPFQLGGAVVAEKGGEILFVYRSKASSDVPPVDRLISTVQ